MIHLNLLYCKAATADVMLGAQYARMLASWSSQEIMWPPSETTRNPVQRVASWFVERAINFPQAAAALVHSGTADLLHQTANTLPGPAATALRAIVLIGEVIGHHHDARKAGYGYIAAVLPVAQCMATRTPLPVHILDNA